MGSNKLSCCQVWAPYLHGGGGMPQDASVHLQMNCSLLNTTSWQRVQVRGLSSYAPLRISQESLPIEISVPLPLQDDWLPIGIIVLVPMFLTTQCLRETSLLLWISPAASYWVSFRDFLSTFFELILLPTSTASKPRLFSTIGKNHTIEWVYFRKT